MSTLLSFEKEIKSWPVYKEQCFSYIRYVLTKLIYSNLKEVLLLYFLLKVGVEKVGWIDKSYSEESQLSRQ